MQQTGCIQRASLENLESLPTANVITFVSDPISSGRLPTILFSSISSHFSLVKAPIWLGRLPEKSLLSK